MKKTIKAILIMAVICCSGADLFSQNKQLEKQRKKEYKAKMKQYQRDGYKIVGSSRTIGVMLLTHYERLNTGKYEEINIITENCPSMNLCDRKSLTDASSKYATLANSFVRGKVTSASGYDAVGEDDLAQDRFYGAYEQKVSAEISKKLKKAFSVYSEKTKRYESYYYVDEEAAHKARLNALRQAQEETDANIEWSNSISDFINEVPTQQ